MIISNISHPLDVIYVGGTFIAIFLIIITMMSLFISETKYWNKYISNTFDACLYSLLFVFIAIVIFKITFIMS